MRKPVSASAAYHKLIAQMVRSLTLTFASASPAPRNSAQIQGFGTPTFACVSVLNNLPATLVSPRIQSHAIANVRNSVIYHWNWMNQSVTVCANSHQTSALLILSLMVTCASAGAPLLKASAHPTQL